MICVCIHNRDYAGILEVLRRPDVEMAEIRLDLCSLSDEETADIFANSDTPLIATCRSGQIGPEEAFRRLSVAVEAGARFADLETDAPASISKRMRKLCRDNGTELIRSYHDFNGTPDLEGLQIALARCFRYGADIAKVVTMCNGEEDAARLESLYSVILEGIDTLEGRLIAFGMGEAGRLSRLECLRRSAPFTYAALNRDEAVAPGQWTLEEMRRAVYGVMEPFVRKDLRMPASKSFAQRAIIAAALAKGTSTLHSYTACDDSEAAISVAESLGAKVIRRGADLIITGIGPIKEKLHKDSIDVGESGLLARLMIPLMSALNEYPVTINGRGTLLNRPLSSASDIMAAFGVILSNEGDRTAKSAYVPLKVRGQLIPGTADITGKAGSQLISGLLMALPLCSKPSTVYVGEPRSIPYMYITLDVLRHFGIGTRSEMEGDAEMLEQQDWSYCTGISFRTKALQEYRAAEFAIESDWSAAANFLVAGAVFGDVEILGLDTGSLQADLSIIDILVEAGASVSQTENPSGGEAVCVRKAPLEAFTTSLDNAPDLFPIVSVLAAFCSGESRIGGVGRLSTKESDRGGAILEMLTKMGVEARIEEDAMVINGETLTSRLLGGRLLHGGEYSSRHDHRMVMALKVASLGADSPVIIDDEACVAKSFPGFSI